MYYIVLYYIVYFGFGVHGLIVYYDTVWYWVQN